MTPVVGRLHYNYMRVYSSADGRFLEPDTLRQRDDLALYRYSRSDPINHSDRLGLWAAGAGVGASGGLVPIPAKLGIVWDADCYIVRDEAGNWNVLCCAAGGPGTGIGASGNVTGSWIYCPDCRTVCDLSGDIGGVVAGAGPVGGGVGGGMSGSTITGSVSAAGFGGGGYAGFGYGSCKLLFPERCDSCSEAK